MQIIQLKYEDFDCWQADLEDLIRETIKYNFPGNLPQEDYYPETVASVKKYLEKDQAVVFLLLDEERLLGWAWCHDIQRFHKKRLHIASFAVKSGSRNMGVGSELIAAVEEYAQAHSYDGVDLLVTASNETAVRFYEKNGLTTERLLMRKDFENDH